MANLTTEWRDENKFTFLWKGAVILVHQDRERGKYKILSNVDEFVKEDIYRWLRNGTIRTPKREEQEEEAENDKKGWNRFR